MAVTKEEVGRRPTVERAANLSADPCWHEKADNSVSTMRGVLKERGSMVMICEIVVFILIFILCVGVCEREREILSILVPLRFLRFFWKNHSYVGREGKRRMEFILLCRIYEEADSIC